ncbi:MAG: 30S ribosomal protein S4 [Candidatus Buchananbacteria bacterium]
MGRNVKPLTKRIRRIGDKFFLAGERPFSSKAVAIKRNYPPGQHGPKGHGRLSTFGLQLKEKQKAKLVYGILEKQLNRYFKIALKYPGNTSETLYQALELRLDSVVFLAGLAKSRPQARQFVGHGHIMVNGKKVNIPSYRVEKGEVISLSPKGKKAKIFEFIKEDLKNIQTPEWLALDKEKVEAKVLDLPTFGQNQLVNWQAIVEFYSR